MKKLLSLILVFIMIFTAALAFTACGSSEENSSKTNEISEDIDVSDDEEDPDIGGTADDPDDVVKDEDEPEEIDDEVLDYSEMSEFDPRESISILTDAANYNKRYMSEEAMRSLEKAAEKSGLKYEWDDDGDLILYDGSGITYLGNDWPENVYTEDLPIPEGTVVEAIEDTEEAMFAILMDWQGTADAKKYAESLKNAGFTYDAYEEEPDENNYLFAAGSTFGKSVMTMYSDGIAEIAIY